MRFRDALLGSGTPILYECLPPKLEDGAAGYDRAFRDVESISRYPVTAINIPELGKEAQLAAKPRVSPELFGTTVLSQNRYDVILCRTVFDRDLGQHRSWIEDRVASGLTNYVFVGPPKAGKYRGLSVQEATAAASEWRGDSDYTLGSILIPWRDGEAERAQKKYSSGTDFFTTQFLFDSEDTVSVLRSMKGKPRIFLGFAPAAGEKDLRLLQKKFRGKISDSAMQQLSRQGTGHAAIGNALGIYDRIREVVEAEHLEVSLGIQVEPIWERNESLGIEMLHAFSETVSGRR